MTTTTTTDAPEPGALPRLRQLAAATREAIDLRMEKERLERLNRERSEAVRTATCTITGRFRNTLGTLLSEGVIELVGYPALHEDEVDIPVQPCAVAYLGDGVWLHHTEARDGWSVLGSRMTLLIPCVSGRYRVAPIEDEYTLASVLNEADAQGDVCCEACVPSVRIDPDDGEEDR